MVLKINLNMTNKWLYSFIIIGILLFVGTGAYAYVSPLAMGHGGDTVWIKTSQGVETTLQGAIDAGAFACTVVTGEGLTGRIIRDIAFTGGSSGGSTCVITNENITLCAGRNDYFQLGIGDSSHRAKFGLVGGGEGLKNVSKIIGSRSGFYALLTDKTVKSWGYNGYGQLGTGDTTDKNLPVSVLDSTGGQLTNVKSIETRNPVYAYEHTCAVLNDGTVKCWGYNGYGQLGTGDTTDRSKATTVSGITNAIDVKLGGHSSGGYTCALLNDGTVKCWGYNGYGQLGDGTTASRSSPVVVSGLTNVKEIYPSKDDYGYTCALLNDGTVKCWGYNGYGQLGTGDTTDRSAPYLIPSLSGVKKLELIGAGSFGSVCALLNGGSVKCWGYNGYGRLGVGGDSPSYMPSLVGGDLANVVDISGTGWGYEGYYCALIRGGTIKCWGYNGYGQLGDGTTTTRNFPTSVVGISSAIAIKTGGQNSYEKYTCAILNTGKINCWGWNGYGGFGTGNTLSAILPTEVN